MTAKAISYLCEKEAFQDLWSENELRERWGDATVNELLSAGMQFTPRPCLTAAEAKEWASRLARNNNVSPHAIFIDADIQEELLIVDGKAFDVDQQCAAIVKCLLEADGERRSQRDMKDEYPQYIINERIDNLIRRKLKTHKSGIGRYIQSDKRGFRLVLTAKQRE